MPNVITNESEQLTLFTFDENGNTLCENRGHEPIVITPVTKTVKAPQPVAAKKEKPKNELYAFGEEPRFNHLVKQLCDAASKNDLLSVLNLIDIKLFAIGKLRLNWSYGQGHSYNMYERMTDHSTSSTNSNVDMQKAYGIDQAQTCVFRNVKYNGDKTEFDINITYVSDVTGNAVVIPVHVTAEYDVNTTTTREEIHHVREMVVKKPLIPTKLMYNVHFVQAHGEIEDIIRDKKPWLHNWIKQNYNQDFQLESCVVAPWLETLYKAGYENITTDFLKKTAYADNDQLEEFNRLCTAGTKPKDIFKCSKTIQTVLKNERRLYIWDTFRKLEKRTPLNEDSARVLHQMRISAKDLEKIYSILAFQRGGRFIFTVQSLVNYLGRLDMYEALETSTAIQYLDDYLHMCRTLDMPPRVDGDSLRREHDIAARLCREQRNKIAEEKMRVHAEKERNEMAKPGSKLSRAEYHESVFFIRPILEYNDLLDEAKQQDNCVACYADRISSGQSRIFTMRETAHPDRSLITIELSPDCKTIRQKYLARNQAIRNKSMNDFITRWHRQLNTNKTEENAA